MRKKLVKSIIAMFEVTAIAASTILSPMAATVSEVATVDSEQKAIVNYVGNQGKLKENPFLQLPLGSVKANGWLENQLLLQKQGITGNMKNYANYNKDTSAWLGKNGGEAWENGPYYLRGLVSLAYELEDEELIKEAQAWIDWAIESQREDGFFGPTNNTDWWPRMPMMMAIIDYYEATEAKGNPDERVIPFLTKYFKYQKETLPKNPLSSWASARGGDNLYSVYWLYNRVYDKNNAAESDWLIELGDLILSQTMNWENEYNNTTVRQHVVNTTQGMKTPAVYSQYSTDEKYQKALENGIFNMGIDHGRIDGLANSDEAARENKSTTGSENCGVVEGLLSTEIAMKILGEGWIGDRLEQLAYNALPAVYTPDYSGHTYYVLQNQVAANLGNHEFGNDHGDSSAFGAPLGFDCCYANTHMGWSKYIQSMWMATSNQGLALVTYGPNQVEATVAGDKVARFTSTTDYPFKDLVELDYQGEKAEFELKLRIPEWSENTSIKVNGIAQTGIQAGEFYTINKAWNIGDKVEIQFNSELEVSTWYNDSKAVQKGALIYGLKIQEDWRTVEDNDLRELKVEHQEQSPLREVYAASDWNYALVLDDSQEDYGMTVETKEEIPMQPFGVDSAPVTIKAKGQLVPEWTYDGNIAGPQPFGGVAYNADAVSEIELIPYGSGRLRISQFPAAEVNAQIKEDSITCTDKKVVTRSGVSYQEFDNIVVPSASGYNLEITGTGSGTITINGKYSTAIDLSSGSASIKNVQTLLGGYFQFTNGRYNNLRFTGDVQVDQVNVSYINRTITEPKILSFNRSTEAIQLVTNLDVQETSYRVEYGTEQGNYTNTVRGFNSSTAKITGIDPDTTYYLRVVTTIDGVDKESKEVVCEPALADGELKPDPNAPNAVYHGFETINYIFGTEHPSWTKLDPSGTEEQPNIDMIGESSAPDMRFEKSDRVKAYYNNGNVWTDYVAETELSIDKVDTNNCGMILRGSNFGEGPDAFQGYFVGIGYLNNVKLDNPDEGDTSDRYSGPGIMIGYSDGSWHDLKILKWDIQKDTKYKLKTVMYGNRMAVYLDGQLVTTYTDVNNLYANGTVGLRSYMEAFTAYSVDVRNVTEEDLVDFEKDVTSEAINFKEDFEDAELANQVWSKVGADSSIMNIADGKLTVGNGESTDAKVVSGEPTWSDYVYEAKVELGTGNGNAGLLIRSSKEGEGADNYYGYYFGISNNRFEIGKASNNWTPIANQEYEFNAEKEHVLKVIAYKNQLVFFIDGNQVYQTTDDSHVAGRVGIRSYQRNCKVDDIIVRSLNEDEIPEQAEIAKLEVTSQTLNHAVALKMLRDTSAKSFKVAFGKTPGVYTDEFVDIQLNTYKGDFKAEQTVVDTFENGTFYVKVYGLSGNTIVSESDEMEITTGYLETVETIKSKFEAAQEKANTYNENNYTQESYKRLALAKAYANKIAQQEVVNQMEYGTAMNLLYLSINGLKSGADKTTLKAKIDEADTIDLEQFLSVGKDYFIKALADAKAIYENADASEQEVEEAYKTLQNSIFKLRERPDKSKLEDLIYNAQSKEATKYTTESFAVLTKALDAAKLVKENKEATAEEVAMVEASLTKAIDELVEKPDDVKEGWKEQKDGSWRYQLSDGTFATSTWKLIYNHHYYFNNEGYMVTGWAEVDNKWYYLKANGAMATGWMQVAQKWYYLQANGVMETGWAKVDNRWYYLKANGVMATGWTKVDNRWYYLKANGVMATGWEKVDQKWYYLKANGAMTTGWVKVDNKWYYMKANGVMTRDWVKVRGTWYYLKETGEMTTGWVKIRGTWYYLNKDGSMAIGWILDGKKTYYLSTVNGAWNGQSK